MSAAAEWAATSPYAPDPRADVQMIGALSVSNLSWSQQQQAMSQAPVLGGRRQWCDYSFEMTGYGSLELCGPLAYRVTIVHPDDVPALRQLHRLVCTGRLRPAWYRRQMDASHVHVIDRAELCRTRADARGSWLFAAQAVARLCGTDDEIAHIAGSALRRLLWTGRPHLGSEHFTAAATELRRATEELAGERRRYAAALERRLSSGPRSSARAPEHRRTPPQLVRDDVECIRLEAQVLAEVRREWEGPSPGDMA